jgi:hypothetical protein
LIRGLLRVLNDGDYCLSHLFGCDRGEGFVAAVPDCCSMRVDIVSADSAGKRLQILNISVISFTTIVNVIGTELIYPIQ